MSRENPKNREEAFVYQFEDDVKALHSLSYMGENKFEAALRTLESHISAYRSKRLRNESAKTKIKSEARDKYMKEKFPSLYK